MDPWYPNAPFLGQPRYPSSFDDESELVNFDALNRTDALSLEAFKKVFGSNHKPAEPRSLLGDLANLPVPQTFEGFPMRPLYPFLGPPGTAAWVDPWMAPKFGQASSGATANPSWLDLANSPLDPKFGSSDHPNWLHPASLPATPFGHLGTLRLWPASPTPSARNMDEMPDPAFDPSGFQAPNRQDVLPNPFDGMATPSPQLQDPLLATSRDISAPAADEPQDEWAAAADEARRAAAMRTGQWRRFDKREYELDLTEPEYDPEADSNEPDLRERERLNRVDAYYRGTAAGRGQFKMLGHAVFRSDPEGTSPENRKFEPAGNSATDASEPDPRQRARLNLVNSYYRNSLAGAGRLKFLKYVASTPDPEGTSPADRSLRQAFRNEYRQISADLERYDRERAAKTSSEFGAAAAGQPGEYRQVGASPQYDPIGTARGINRYANGGNDPIGRLDPFGPASQSMVTTQTGPAATQASAESDDSNVRPTQVQWLPSFVRPFTGGGLEFFAKPPALPLKQGPFGNLMRWGKNMEAKEWAENVRNNPEFRRRIIDDLEKAKVTRKNIDEYINFYRQAWNRWDKRAKDGDPIGKSTYDHFGHRADGMQHLLDQWPAEFPSTTPPLPLLSNPYGSWCPDPTQCT